MCQRLRFPQWTASQWHWPSDMNPRMFWEEDGRRLQGPLQGRHVNGRGLRVTLPQGRCPDVTYCNRSHHLIHIYINTYIIFCYHLLPHNDPWLSHYYAMISHSIPFYIISTRYHTNIGFTTLSPLYINIWRYHRLVTQFHKPLLGTVYYTYSILIHDYPIIVPCLSHHCLLPYIYMCI